MAMRTKLRTINSRGQALPTNFGTPVRPMHSPLPKEITQKRAANAASSRALSSLKKASASKAGSTLHGGDAGSGIKPAQVLTVEAAHAKLKAVQDEYGKKIDHWAIHGRGPFQGGDIHTRLEAAGKDLDTARAHEQHRVPAGSSRGGQFSK